jgi:hypothetical protein
MACAQTGSVRIRVTDLLGSPVPGATASLLDTNRRPVSTLLADGKGEILWTGLPFGQLHFEVLAPGFDLLQLTVSLSDHEEQTLDAQLKVGCLECVPNVETFHMPNSEALDLAAPSPQSKSTKHHWWQIFH